MKLRILLCAAIAVAWASSASAQVRITRDVGGLIQNYVDRYQDMRASGERVLIDGPCLSACTLVVGILPPDRVCVTKHALLGFHAAWEPTANGKVLVPSETRRMLHIYPAALRTWITRNGGLKAQMIFLHGRMLANLVRPCREVEVSQLR